MRLQTQVAPEIQKRLLLSRVEAESLKERDILCALCIAAVQWASTGNTRGERCLIANVCLRSRLHIDLCNAVTDSLVRLYDRIDAVSKKIKGAGNRRSIL